MSTNVERKGKEKPKKGRKEKREPTNHTQFGKRNERQAGIKNSLICTTPDAGNGGNGQLRDLLVPLERVELCW